MTRDEVKRLLSMIKVVYPAHSKGLTDEEYTATINAWHFVLEEYDGAYIGAGLKKLFKSTVFPPTPADVIRAADECGKYGDALFLRAVRETNALPALVDAELKVI